MASVEQLLNEAQYAFHSINSGESRDNRRNAARARSLCKKIIRKFPTSTEAVSAHDILRRLGDEAFLSSLSSQHRHSAEHVPHEVPSPASQPRFTLGDETVVLDWRGLLKPIFNAPKASLAVIGTAVIILFTVFGPFFWFPLIALVLFTGPFKQQLQAKHRQKVNQFITRINAYVEERRKGGVS
jgi:hypothetical protein